MPFIELQSVDSTNNYALAQVNAGLAQHGACFFAHEQFAGKGQRGKVWTADADSSLILSIVLEPSPLRLTQQFPLSACIALAVCDFFSKYAGEHTKIKWPNDLYWQDRKAGGILIENLVGSRIDSSGRTETGAWRFAIAGMGINLNQAGFPEGLSNPVSLKQITGKEFDPMRLARELVESIQKWLLILENQGFDFIYERYLNLLYKRGETIRLKVGNRGFEASLTGVTRSGKLLVNTGMEEEFEHGEIAWTIPSVSG